MSLAAVPRVRGMITAVKSVRRRGQKPIVVAGIRIVRRWPDAGRRDGRKTMQFANRITAGRALAKELSGYANRSDVVVLALPRGGVPVAYEVAHRLGAPMDVFLVRKLGVPGQEELAMGAIATGGTIVLNPQVLQYARVPRDEIERVTQAEWEELDRRQREYRQDLPPPLIEGKTVILIDDGLATGASMRAAAQAVRKQQPAKLIIAVPVAATESCEAMRDVADDVICAMTPQPFSA